QSHAFALAIRRLKRSVDQVHTVVARNTKEIGATRVVDALVGFDELAILFGVVRGGIVVGSNDPQRGIAGLVQVVIVRNGAMTDQADSCVSQPTLTILLQ